VAGDSRTLFGREVELRALTDALALDRSTLVVGEAGIGKTALVRAAVAASGRDLREGGALLTLRWNPYLALRRAVGEALEGDPVVVAAAVERRIGPDVLFVDDFQWSDDGTREAIELLAGRILVVAAIRRDDPLASDAIAACHRSGLDVIELAPLTEDAAAAVIRDRQPGLADAAVNRLVRQAGGNPLVLEELATGEGVSPAFERSVVRRLAGLGSAGRAAVELLAVLGQPVERSIAGEGVTEAITASLVIEHAGQVAIRHELVAAAVVEAISAAERRRLHARAAMLVADPADQVRHLAAAGRRTAAATLARSALDATGDPRARAALLIVAAEVAPPSRDLSLRLAAARELDELSEWATIVRLLAPDGEATPDELTERDAILAHALFALADIHGSRERLTAAAARDVPVASQAAVRRAIETATFMVNVDGAVGSAIALLDTAAAAQAPDSLAARDTAVLRTCILLLASGSGDASIVHPAFAEAFAAGRFRTAADRARVMQYLLLLGTGADVGLQYLLDVTARYDAAGVGSVAVEFKADAALAAHLAGRFELTVTLADELLERPSPSRPRQTAEIARARSLGALGRLDEAEASLTRLEPGLSPDWFGRGEFLAARAELADWSGRPKVALELIEASLAIPAPVPIAHVTPGVIRSSIQAQLGLDPAGVIYTPLAPSLAGAPHEVAGLERAHAGHHEAAAAAFERAATGWAGFQVPRSLICQWAAGDALRLAGRRDEAVERLTAAHRAATEVAFEALAARIRRSLRQAGVRATTASERSGSAGGLTARERELVGLVERGLTNIEIARRLGLGRPTVARILSSAMGKLGVESRAQLAARVEA